jgi:hypothetical protein
MPRAREGSDHLSQARAVARGRKSRAGKGGGADAGAGGKVGGRSHRRQVRHRAPAARLDLTNDAPVVAAGRARDWRQVGRWQGDGHRPPTQPRGGAIDRSDASRMRVCRSCACSFVPPLQPLSVLLSELVVGDGRRAQQDLDELPARTWDRRSEVTVIVRPAVRPKQCRTRLPAEAYTSPVAAGRALQELVAQQGAEQVGRGRGAVVRGRRGFRTRILVRCFGCWCCRVPKHRTRMRVHRMSGRLRQLFGAAAAAWRAPCHPGSGRAAGVDAASRGRPGSLPGRLAAASGAPITAGGG